MAKILRTFFPECTFSQYGGEKVKDFNVGANHGVSFIYEKPCPEKFQRNFSDYARAFKTQLNLPDY